MPKRKRAINNRQRRERDRDRKRQERQKSEPEEASEDKVSEFSVLGRSEDGAVLAPPGNFPGLGSMGLPPKEEKPLARVQASPRVRMHSPAPRLPPPRGSRLFVRNEDKAPSPDSPPWVCAPPRAPGSDIGHMSGPAGQAQLDTSREEETSRISKDEGTLTDFKTESERILKGNLNEYNIESEMKTSRNENENNEKHTISETCDKENLNEGNESERILKGNLNEYNIESEMKTNRNENNEIYTISETCDKENLNEGNDPCWQKSWKRGNYDINYSIQGSFHQAHPIFEDNAGTQCVANCLAGLAFHKLKNAKNWTTMDMDRILMTGDELYTYLQRSSSITDRYLLVEELPQLFECFNRSYQFHANESVASVIMANDCLNYAEFNALPLYTALQVALTDTDGCFVCFGGNTMLIGSTESGFFAFDSHSRSSDGMLSVTGKSTRILFQNVNEVYSYLQGLAFSMGYSEGVECNLSGVTCKMNYIASVSALLEEEEDDTSKLPKSSELLVETTVESCDRNVDVIFVGHEQLQYSFIPLTNDMKKQICHELNIPFICRRNACEVQCYKTNITEPRFEKEIIGDGNCFFRAVSFSLTNSEDFHNIVRKAVCEHMMGNKELFKPFLKDGVQSVESHMSSTQMSQESTWATEVEIFATAHMLNTDLYTYSGGCWLRFLVAEVDPCRQSRTGAIYLNHHQQNHYNVVLSVNGEEMDLQSMEQDKIPQEYQKRFRNRTRMQESRQVTSKVQKILSASEKRRQSLRKRYQEDVQFREKKLKLAYQRYLNDEEFQANVKLVSKTKYCNDSDYHSKTKVRSKKRSFERYLSNDDHREEVKQRSIDKYAKNDYHKEDVKKRSIEKYALDKEHRDGVKKKSIEKYAVDKEHRDGVKKKSIEKYAVDKEHRDGVKKKSIEKYSLNKEHRDGVKKRSIERYAINEEHREEIKKRSIERYATDEQHREEARMRSIQKYKSNAEHREDVKAKSRQKYKSDEMYRNLVNTASIKRYKENENFRERKLHVAAEKYKSDECFRSKRKAFSKKQYDSSVLTKMQKKARVKSRRIAHQARLENQEEIVRVFKGKAMQGIDYSCCCCDRLFFQNQVQRCEQKTYSKNEEAANIADLCIQEKYCHQCSESCTENCVKSKLWICFTCHRKIMRGSLPAEAAFNKMALEDIPKELKDLNSLEKHLIAIHIPFMKVMALPHGGQKNIHGPVVCVPSDLMKVTSLPMKPGEDLLLRVKLKRKLNYKGYIEYQFVDPKHIFNALNFLKRKNQWYEDVAIDTNWKGNCNDFQEMSESDSLLDDDDDRQYIATDTCLQPVDIGQEVLDHYFDDIYDISPGEGNNPVRMLQEEGNEAKTFPFLFPSGRFSWNDNREIRITLSRYFNNRLMNTDGRFAKDSSYIFFSQFLSDLNQVIEKTQISIRKSVRRLGSDQFVTSDMVQNPEVLSKLMKNDEALRFMQPIRGTPAYWSAAQKDLFAMLRQLGIPTWFCSFSAAEHRWNDAVATILRQQCDSRDPSLMDWSEKNEVLRSNPVTVARMFEHRFHLFQTEVIFSPLEPIGKVSDFFQRVEFQQRGSPHMHCLYWIENAPKLDEDGEEAVCNFIDKYVSCAVPSQNEDLELRDIVLAVQQHSRKHSKSCRKKGTECRFNFPRPPSVCTFINSPVEQESLENAAEATDLKHERSISREILLRVWNEVQDEANETHTTEEIFEHLGLTQEQYEDAHKRLAKKRTVILERNPCELWINQYNPCLLKCWDANMDIQFVLDPFSCIVYIISYISKSEREMGMVLKQTKIEAEEGNESARTTLKKIGSAYLNHREVSAQEAVYRVCNLKMKECSRKVVFVPVGENPTRLTKPLSQLKRKHSLGDDEHDENDDDEEDIWMTNIVERYANRPNKPLFQNMCLAEFCSEFRVLAKSQVPKSLNENVFELQNNKGFIQRRTRTKPAVIRYPRFSAEKMSEKYYQSLLQLFLPYWTEPQLKPPGFDLYETFYENGHVRITGKKSVQSVKSIVDTNRLRYAENEELIEEAQDTFENIGEPEDAWANLCPETELMREECSYERNKGLDLDVTEDLPDMQTEINCDVLFKVEQNIQSKEETIQILQNLNETQTKVFYLVREWCLAKHFGEKTDALHIFITGGAGTGKSHLIKAIHYEASRILGKNLTSPDSVSVLLAAFTGTAAFNIGGNTIHHLFSLPKYMSLPYEPLREQSLSEMRVHLGDLQILVIDEISMVYKRLLYYVHERLVQIKKCREPFGGVSVIAVGDFYQLPPVKQRKDERLYKENAAYPVDHWLDLFKVVELSEIMRQREDIPFATALNSLRSREIKEPLEYETDSILKECEREGPHDVLHVYATNDEVNAYNLTMLRGTCEDIVEIDAQDFTKDRSSGKLILRSKPLTRSRTDNLSSSLLMGVGARVMLTRNCNVEDGLVNGVMGHITHFVYGQIHGVNNVVAVGVIFDNINVGMKSGNKTRNGNIVLIERVQEEILEQKTKNVVRHQFPLRLSWACTAHKVQGMTVDKVVVNLDRTFSPGQGYVALSRVTSKQGLFIETNDIESFKKKIYADPEVKSALQGMPKLILPNFDASEQGITIYLHNIQSLNKHFEDLRKDIRCRNANIICLTETWLRSGQNVSSLKIKDFHFHQATRGDVYDETNAQMSKLRASKGGGVALYIKETEHEKIVSSLPVKNVEGICVKCVSQDIIVLTVYRPNSLDVSQFLLQFEKVMSYYKSQSKFCVCLGDFNEDARSAGSIQTFMTNQGFKQLVNFNTTEGATILDHVYLSTSLQAEVKKISTYYSYHDALMVTIISDTEKY
ncbi:uncharacterized protein LOC134276047 [Saccostrea cucullata]|uniref:uncharacterized protein LOC134276047 n=1 Tax=Saccostrea cuccullata TaxID=36930 RepID=UPI002ED0BE7A